MPVYTYNNQILTDGGAIAVTDGLCCGACCVEDECSNKNKCDCDKENGTWHAGKDCNDEDFSCDSSSSSSSSSSKSSSSSSSSFSWPSYSSSCEYGACCIRTLEQSPGSPGEGDYYTYQCIDNKTEEQCSDYAEAENTRFIPCKTCDEVDCEDWPSSSSSKSSSSKRGGWVCKPVWVCEAPCETAEDCPKNCPEEYPVSIQQENGAVCCPEGAVGVEDGNCVDADGNILGVQYEPDPRCCAGTCCDGPDVIGCCGDQCLKEGQVCCDETDPKNPIIKNADDMVCCGFNFGPAMPMTAQDCIAAGGTCAGYKICPGKNTDGDQSAPERQPCETPGIIDNRPDEDYCVYDDVPCILAECFQAECFDCMWSANEIGLNKSPEDCAATCQQGDPAGANLQAMRLAVKIKEPDYICDD